MSIVILVEKVNYNLSLFKISDSSQSNPYLLCCNVEQALLFFFCLPQPYNHPCSCYPCPKLQLLDFFFQLLEHPSKTGVKFQRNIIFFLPWSKRSCWSLVWCSGQRHQSACCLFGSNTSLHHPWGTPEHRGPGFSYQQAQPCQGEHWDNQLHSKSSSLELQAAIHCRCCSSWFCVELKPSKIMFTLKIVMNCEQRLLLLTV